MTTTSPLGQPHLENVYSFGLSLSNLQSQIKLLSDAATTAHSDQQIRFINTSTTDDSPCVFLTDGTNDQPAIMRIVEQFTLNEAQQRAFRIIAYHTLGRSKVGPQLRMGIFRQGGTGKSRLIAAIRAWFCFLNRQNEVIVTATTGTAAFNIKGITLHSAANLPIGKHATKNLGVKRAKTGPIVITLLWMKSA